MEAINIAIIGANGVGKSHLLQRALNLSRAPSTYPFPTRVTIDSQPFIVTMIELDLESFDIDTDQDQERQFKWPTQVGGSLIPPIHGVLLLYDVMNRDSIIQLPQTLHALVNSNLPTVLVATKCDNPDSVRQIDTEAVANACKSCIASFKTSANKPESARMSLATLLKAIVSVRRDSEASESTGARRRAASSAAHLDTQLNNRPLSQHSKHSRASSDMSLLRGFPNPPPDPRAPNRAPRIDFGTPGMAVTDETGEEDASAQSIHSMLRTPGIRLERVPTASFLDMDESDAESFRYSEDIPILQRNDDALFEKPAKATGISFEELVDRLIAPKLTKADTNFSDIFLCLYRKFTTPMELFSAILTRLEQVKEDKNVHYLIKTAAQLRIIEVVAQWVSLYASDFGRPKIRRKLEEFIRHLSTEPVFAAAAQQMRRNLELTVLQDDDTGWTKVEDDEDEVSSLTTVSSTGKDRGHSGEHLTTAMSNLSTDEPHMDRRPSAASSFNVDAGGKTHQFQFHSYEDYEREAATMVPTTTLPLTKFRYHIFMDTSNDDIADELTRIDWVMFSSIRIRDLVRHVSLSLEKRDKTAAMKNVNLMINHFNHVAKWVANMILMRDKAKHRAQMLEKFMNIALKLRVLNNYNGLAAVLAGINGTAIHRLIQTRSLVAAEVQKRFARLVLLMGTQKSHFAYRLAWENSPLPRIPFMPLHRRDLVSAEEGSRTFVGPSEDRINWKKFEVLGEVLLPIMKSQGTPYPNLAKHDVARELILDCLMPTDEEEIYQRSVQVESSGGSGFDPGKKKFPWFAKS